MAIFSVDYSKAWICGGFPLPSLPFDLSDVHHKTVHAQRNLTARWGKWIDEKEADELLAKIKLVKKQDVKRIIEAHPKGWLPESRKRSILRWWGSEDFNARIEGISVGIKNGAYL